MALTKKQELELTRLLALEAKVQASKSYKAYVRYTNPGYQLMPYNELIISTIEQALDKQDAMNRGEIPKANQYIMMSMPPRHGKSHTVTETLPSYVMGKHKKYKGILTAYSSTLADDFARANSRKTQEFNVFGATVKVDNQDRTEYSNGSTFVKAGILGGITGKGANCFPKGVMVSTEIGEIEISELTAMENPPLVWSYNPECGIIELKKLLATKERVTHGLTEITTKTGIKIKSTGEHLYYTKERGYQQASLLNTGDALIKAGDVLPVRSEDGEAFKTVSSVLREIKKNSSGFNLYSLWERVRASSLRIREAYKKRAGGFLLFSGMQGGGFQNEIFPTLSSVWESVETQSNVLFTKVQRVTTGLQTAKTKLPGLQQGVPSGIKAHCILFSNVCRQRAFNSNDGEKQLSLQGWDKLFKAFQRNEALGVGTRQSHLPSVQPPGSKGEKNESYSASHQRIALGQHPGELDNHVQYVSRNTPQVESDSVYSVKTVSEAEHAVYDIQVEGNSNFFANKILVHNCLLIDDPIKTSEEAQSETHRNKVWGEWQASLSTRLEPPAIVILIMTRWHEDDLAGRLLNEEYGKPLPWTVINLPMEAEDNDILGRAVGEPLWPDKYGLDFIEERKQYPSIFNSLYQGRPTAAEGNILKRHYWQYYDARPEFLARIPMTIMSVDAAFKDTKDPVGIQIWGKHMSNYYLIDRINERLDFTATLNAIRAMLKKYPECHLKLIEDKANGSAIINVLNKEIGGFIPVQPYGNKVSRVQAVLPYIEAGNVYLPRYYNAEEGKCIQPPWVNEFIEQCASFPTGAHDEDPDALSQALSRLVAMGTMGNAKGPGARDDFGIYQKENPDEIDDSYIEMKVR